MKLPAAVVSWYYLCYNALKMKGLLSFLIRRFWPLLFIVVGLVLVIVAIDALTGVPGFSIFFVGAAVLIIGILTIIY